jgi:hypothetical protein
MFTECKLQIKRFVKIGPRGDPHFWSMLLVAVQCKTVKCCDMFHLFVYYYVSFVCISLCFICLFLSLFHLFVYQYVSFVCLSVWLSDRLFTCHVCLSVYAFTSPSVFQSICLVHLSCPSVLSICLVHLSCPSVLSICPSVCLLFVS